MSEIRPYSASVDFGELAAWHAARNLDFPYSTKWGYILPGVLYFSMTPLGEKRIWVEDLVSNPKLGIDDSWGAAKYMVDWVIDSVQGLGKIALMSSEVSGVQKFLMRYCGEPECVTAIWKFE